MRFAFSILSTPRSFSWHSRPQLHSMLENVKTERQIPHSKAHPAAPEHLWQKNCNGIRLSLDACGARCACLLLCHFFLTVPGLPEPLLALLVVMHERCDVLVACHCPCAARVLVVRQTAQLNGSDCGVWTLYALYWRCLKRAIKQDKRRLFADMAMKDPNDALQFRSSSLAVCRP
jgi:hypothetical protein